MLYELFNNWIDQPIESKQLEKSLILHELAGSQVHNPEHLWIHRIRCEENSHLHLAPPSRRYLVLEWAHIGGRTWDERPSQVDRRAPHGTGPTAPTAGFFPVVAWPCPSCISDYSAESGLWYLISKHKLVIEASKRYLAITQLIALVQAGYTGQATCSPWPPPSFTACSKSPPVADAVHPLLIIRTVKGSGSFSDQGSSYKPDRTKLHLK